MNEATLQQALVDHVRQVHGLLVVEFAKPGTHGRLRGVLPSGWPDWCVIGTTSRTWFQYSGGLATRADSRSVVQTGVHVYFETKMMRGKLSLDQIAMHEAIAAAGCRVEVIQTDSIADGIFQLEAVLRGEGFTLREWS